ncbi:peptide ABC transporter substrate-binding protein [Aggregatibacter actinomycetemcomitans]|uniref:ABC transporter substrate-binding protein n=1 Tax=Aggregatibacter actinomycetemcomitans TaxID=714 RepID=A0A5D0EMA8_AGGAC|nr:ABC transporter substrate-binding protein [Aggregatibacter actinomycetemcomitans]ANN81717.1 peptide ABC transporter substrate-binding protein [Aggregatibacter actinomycetemcomitans D7S-1]AMQ94908.1 peptide ABC transporter substrate-binding protein [Aggregatibacter actinomycetemcomitans]KND86053.1 peptide ABC transporter substrate-binding protein [Aggregatibacter actinomycetemcomitans serotype a str. H5P1]KOE32145.1 peptide ABC transporter substrate-binding protein [Aggregatibacter actinomyce
MLNKRILTSCCLLAFAVNSAMAAPRVPEELTNNGLIYCTHASGFSFNPQTADAGTSMNVVTEQIYNKLFEISNTSAAPTPVLAQSYSLSPDGKVITIHLRRGIKFHHTDWFKPTRDFNADDVVFSLNRVLGYETYLPTLEQTSVSYKNPQYRIFHEQAKKVRFPYFESIKLNQKIESVKAINPHTVEIILFKPDSSILSHLASQYAIIFSQEYAVQLNADDNLVQLDTLPVGTGPYKVKNYFRNQYVRLEKNTDYWKKDAKINDIIIDLSTDRTGRLIKFFNGECQIASYPEVSQLGLLRENDERYYIKSVEGMNLAYLAFNFQKTAIQDEQLRRAISQAINRQRIIKTIYHNTATVANNIIPNISWASAVNTPDFDYDYNPQQARGILQDKKLSLSMWVINEEQVYNPAPLKTAELIKADLTNAGVEVNIRSVTRTFLIEQLHKKAEDYDMILTGWLGGNLDPDSFMRPILSCSTSNEITNLSNWCSEKFDQIMDEALDTSNQRVRSAAYNQAQTLILSELPIIPIANVKRVLVASSRVQNIDMSPFGSLNFSTLSLRKGHK